MALSLRSTLLLLLLSLTACAGMAPRQADEQAQRAEALWADGEFAAAAQAFQDLAATDARERDAHLLRAAEALRELGAADERMRGVISEINPRRLDADGRIRLGLLRAELAIAAGEPVQAVSELDRIDFGRDGARYRERALELRGRALQRTDPFAAAQVFAQLGELLRGPDKAENVRRIRDLLSATRDSRLKAGASALRDSDPLRPYAMRALTARGFSIPPNLLRPQEQISQRDELPPPTALPPTRRIALLLPASGPLRAAANSVRDGFISARFASGDLDAEIELIDSGDDPAGAIEAYRRAVAAGASEVVGPLTREAVTALLNESDLRVPVLALNRSNTPVPPGHTTFALSPEDEGAAVAALLQQRGQQRVLIVASSDDAAQRALGGFRLRYERSGGQVRGLVMVDEKAIDFLPVIRSALQAAGLPTSRPNDLTQPHDPGFDAVFLAVRAPAARLLVPQLKLFGLSETPMLGTSLLNAGGEDPRLDRELTGVEFCDAPWLIGETPGLPSRQQLARSLDTARGPAARLFAFGMDAWRLLQQRRGNDPDMAMPGATGMLSIDEFGEAQREPGIAVFQNGRPRPVLPGTLVPDGQPQG